MTNEEIAKMEVDKFINRRGIPIRYKQELYVAFKTLLNHNVCVHQIYDYMDRLVSIGRADE